MNFPADVPKEIKISSTISEILGVPPEGLFQGTDDLLAVFPNEESIRAIAPDFRLLKNLPHRGLIVSAPGEEVDFVSRCFYPAYGIDEDPVTGSAHTLMTPYWVKRLGKNALSAQQISQRIGDVGCRLEKDRVLLSGRCVTYMVGEVFL